MSKLKYFTMSNHFVLLYNMVTIYTYILHYHIQNGHFKAKFFIVPGPRKFIICLETVGPLHRIVQRVLAPLGVIRRRRSEHAVERCTRPRPAPAPMPCGAAGAPRAPSRHAPPARRTRRRRREHCPLVLEF